MSEFAQTIGDRILHHVRGGVPVQLSATSVGVAVSRLGEWVREGHALYAEFIAGREWPSFTTAEQDLVAFSVDLDAALSNRLTRLTMPLLLDAAHPEEEQ